HSASLYRQSAHPPRHGQSVLHPSLDQEPHRSAATADARDGTRHEPRRGPTRLAALAIDPVLSRQSRRPLGQYAATRAMGLIPPPASSGDRKWRLRSIVQDSSRGVWLPTSWRTCCTAAGLSTSSCTMFRRERISPVSPIVTAPLCAC